MTTAKSQEFKQKKCLPCEGGIPKIEPATASQLLENLPGWTLTAEGTAIQRKWTAKHFIAAMQFLNKVAELAEQEQHHPDVHLTGYRNLRIEISTHAIGGLSENDFILAAKIDDLPIELKKG